MDVGVEQADARAAARQGAGEIGGDRAFTDPALARTDADDVAHAGQDVAHAQALGHLGGDLDLGTGDAVDAQHRGTALRFELLLHRAGAGGQHQFEARHAAVDREVADHVERDQVLLEVGVLDGGQGRTGASEQVGHIW